MSHFFILWIHPWTDSNSPTGLLIPHLTIKENIQWKLQFRFPYNNHLLISWSKYLDWWEMGCLQNEYFVNKLGACADSMKSLNHNVLHYIRTSLHNLARVTETTKFVITSTVLQPVLITCDQFWQFIQWWYKRNFTTACMLLRFPISPPFVTPGTYPVSSPFQ